MEAIHLDLTPPAMPSHSQMPYAQRTTLHSRSREAGEGRGRGAGYSGYSPVRFISYPPPFRDNPYMTARPPGVVGQQEYPSRSDGPSINNQIRSNRISLLPNTPEYLQPLPRSRHHQNDGYQDQMVGLPPHGQLIDIAPIPIKKIRLGNESKLQSEPHPTIRVETRVANEPPSSSSYNPQVEAISPTLPSEILQEDANFRTTKDELLHGIAKVDQEISKTESQITKLKKRQQELEEAAKKPEEKKDEEELPQPKHQSLAQKIYAENRKKAVEAHTLLDALGPKIDLPLYNQPSDTSVYHENKRKYAAFRGKLLEQLKKKHLEREAREKYMSSTYSRLVQEWNKKIEKIEGSAKRKAKEAKNREFFEKVFPKLRKQREDRERFNRVGARIKSDADLEEIMDGLQEQELEEKKMRAYAVVPPLLLDAKQRSLHYVNNNGQVDDFVAEYKQRQWLNVWTASEREIFKEKFLQHPKNFGIIASYLDRKSVGDCVQYYYLSKKTENYKRLLRKSRQRTRSNRNMHSKVNASGGVSAGGAGGVAGPSALDILNSGPGVTTRLQREQLQKQEAPPPQPSNATPSNNSADCDNTPTNFSPAESSATQPPPPTSSSLLAPQPSEVKLENKKKERRKEEKKKKEEEFTETTDEETSFENGGGSNEAGTVHPCAVCKTEAVCSRKLPRSHAAQYGLSEEQVSQDARVCNLCRCKAVRSRFTNCPLPTCPNSRGHRVKRLRHLPCKWFELPPAVKDPIAAEFQIDSSITKCCSACFSRIVRKIGPAVDSNTGEEGSDAQGSNLLRWTEEETEALKQGLRTYGTRWAEISLLVGPSRTQHQCKSFYFNYRKKLGLDQLLQEYKNHIGEERKPTLTDEEESGSSTSSCDEMGPSVGDSDTASAASPTNNLGAVGGPAGQKSESTSEDMHNPGAGGFNILTTSGGINGPEGEESEKPSNQPAVNEEREESKEASKGPVPPPAPTPVKEDYDSSATETADEGQGGDAQPAEASRTATEKPSEDDDPSLTVKDIMLGVIELQFKMHSGPSNSAAAGGPPTISSILKSEHALNFSQKDKTPRTSDASSSLATVSIVQPQNREPAREPEPMTLDLSIKKPRDAVSPGVSKSNVSLPLPTHSQSSVVYRSGPPPPARVEQPPQTFYPQVLNPSMPPKLSPKLSPSLLPPVSGSSSMQSNKAQCGSIIHGTPVSSPSIYNQNRYDPPPPTLIRQVTPPHKEPGSITQGTPVHQRASMYMAPNSEYYNKRYSPGYYPLPRRPYSVEQRQIIMNDYITSQQMLVAGSSGPCNSREKVYLSGSGTRQGVIQRHNTANSGKQQGSQAIGQPGAPVQPNQSQHQQSQQQSQQPQQQAPSPGISHYPPPPPGHEAFSSLVDVAVRAPSLPVPPHQSSAPIPDLKAPQADDKRHMHEGLGDRFNRESPHDRYREQDRYSRDPRKPTHNTREHQQPLRDQLFEKHLSMREHHYREMRDHQMREHQIREREHQIREQQIRDHQMQQQIQESHQIQRERERELQQQREHQQIRDREIKMRENHLLQQQRDMGNSSRQHLTPFHPGLVMSYPRGDQQPPPPPHMTPPQPPLTSRPLTSQEQSVDGVQRSFTAASLIDAIITHQINLSSDTPGAPVAAVAPQPQSTRPGDRLFQGFHRETPEPNGKISPMKASITPDLKSHPENLAPMQPASSQNMQSEQMEMFNNSQPQVSRGGSYQGFDHQSWKLRRVVPSKEMDPSMVRDKGEERSNIVRYYQEPPASLSPLDYVKNRIAEVMRTSEEEGVSKNSDSGSTEMVIDEGEGGTFIPTSHAYTYPYSALNVNTVSAPVLPLAAQPIVKPSEPIPEPAPILSSQYEPLSDED